MQGNIAYLKEEVEDVKHTMQLHEEDHVAKIQKRNEELMQNVVALSAQVIESQQALAKSQSMHRDALNAVGQLVGHIFARLPD